MPDDDGARLILEPDPAACDEAAVAVLLPGEACIWGPLLLIVDIVVTVGVSESTVGAAWLTEEFSVVGVSFGTRVGFWNVPFFHLKVL